MGFKNTLRLWNWSMKHIRMFLKLHSIASVFSRERYQNLELSLRLADGDIPVVPAALGGRHAGDGLPPPVRPLAHLHFTRFPRLCPRTCSLSREFQMNERIQRIVTSSTPRFTPLLMTGAALYVIKPNLNPDSNCLL